MENLNAALVQCVVACGGSKQVAPKLWPEKTPEAAQRLLLDCLNEDRPAHLTPDHVVLILRMARSHGYHGGINYMAESLGYSNPTPIEPKDEIAELQRQFIAATNTMGLIAQRLEALQPQSANFPNLRAA